MLWQGWDCPHGCQHVWSMSGLPLPSLLPDASFDDDELISCCCFNVQGAQKVHTDNSVLIWMVQMTHSVEPWADALMTVCWYWRLQLRRWWHCQQVSGPVNQLMPQQLWGCWWSRQNMFDIAPYPDKEDGSVDDVIHESRSRMFRSSSKYIYTAASCLITPHWARRYCCWWG